MGRWRGLSAARAGPHLSCFPLHWPPPPPLPSPPPPPPRAPFPLRTFGRDGGAENLGGGIEEGGSWIAGTDLEKKEGASEAEGKAVKQQRQSLERGRLR